MGLLLEQADAVPRLERHVTVEILVAAGEDTHQRRLAGPVETQDADLRPVIKRERDVAEDFLALDFLRDADHREDDLGRIFVRHEREPHQLSQPGSADKPRCYEMVTTALRIRQRRVSA
jgi:hypothetical protein